MDGGSSEEVWVLWNDRHLLDAQLGALQIHRYRRPIIKIIIIIIKNRKEIVRATWSEFQPALGNNIPGYKPRV